MTEKAIPVESDEEEEEEDDDYSPTKNDNESKSDDSEESEEETTAEEKPASDPNIKPYDQSKTDELWKNLTSSSHTSKPSTTDVKTEKKIFDYAGEKVSVSVPASSSLKRPAAAASSSANSVLDRLGLGKKQKLSTLEKSRLDWSAHKDTESLHDDLDSHRRGKNSYVEKKAFLERTEQRVHDHYLTNVKKK